MVRSVSASVETLFFLTKTLPKYVNYIDFFFLDESSSKEEPSSTVEEIETKSFNEQSSEEIQREQDEGESSQCVRSSALIGTVLLFFF